ncbi:hypothetical protein F4781DRAFT_408926 [Annulohypoxylon bovei var. microspora]|nr:hypothetical protein F4781DRAFT_408926 [Annulohypoxylon bovei var. microspora]
MDSQETGSGIEIMYEDGSDYTSSIDTIPHAKRRHPDTYVEMKRIERNMKEHFSFVPGWDFEKVIGTGKKGIAILVKNKRGLLHGARYRRLVVKRGISDRGDNELRVEIAWFERVRGAAHIANMITSRNDTTLPDDSIPKTSISLIKRLFSKSHTGRRLRRSRDPRRIDEELQIRELGLYPVIVLEYLENGTFGRLIDRCIHYNATVPNRLLWSFFLCLVRACIGMAYHKNLPGGARTELETIPSDGSTRSELVHGSLHIGNVMIGGGDGRFREHMVAPIVKLIDLGAAAEGMPGTGTEFNLYDISLMMLMLITKRENIALTTSYYRGIGTMATQILGTGGGLQTFPTLDDDLRDLLARCLAVRREHRPGLREMLTEVGNAVNTKTAASYPFNIAPLESDGAIAGFMQRLVYDADTTSLPIRSDFNFIPIEHRGPATRVRRAPDEHRIPEQDNIPVTMRNDDRNRYGWTPS